MSTLSLTHVDVSIYGQAILRDINFETEPGKVLGMVGESGSGKSMTALAIMGLLPTGASVDGAIQFGENALHKMDETQLCKIRGDDMSMVFQEPMTALNPLHTIGRQVVECIRLHQNIGNDQAIDRARETLTRCGLPPEKYSLDRYPHELSGGQRQRVIIAMAVALKPKLLIADEPTTALDVVTQAEILTLLRQLQRDNNMSMILISHDLAVVAQMSDEIVIMRSGRAVDRGTPEYIFSSSEHPYTQQLIEASNHAPQRDKQSGSEVDAPLLQVENLVCEYPIMGDSFWQGKSWYRAVDGVSFSLQRGECLGLVGESGCGKSTLARALLGLQPIAEGKVLLQRQRIDADTQVDQKIRRELQVVFQDPYSSFNPRHKVARLVAEPLYLMSENISATERRQRVCTVLESVGLSADDGNKYIHEFSGGQRQRIAIARALIHSPKLIVLDEAVSALDVSIRAKVLDLLAELAVSRDLAYLFISHDLSVVRHVTDRVMVMHQGKIVESGLTEQVFEHSQNAYTQRLIDAVPLIPDYV